MKKRMAVAGFLVLILVTVIIMPSPENTRLEDPGPIPPIDLSVQTWLV